MALSEAQKQFYWENGFLAVENLIPQVQVIAMRDRIEELCENWDSEAAKRVGVQQESQSGNPITQQSSQTVRKFSGLTQSEFQKDKAVAAPVRAGGCVFHHALSLHMSPPNQTKLWRRAFVCHYVRSDAQMTRDAASLLQVRS